MDASSTALAAPVPVPKPAPTPTPTPAPGPVPPSPSGAPPSLPPSPAVAVQSPESLSPVPEPAAVRDATGGAGSPSASPTSTASRFSLRSSRSSAALRSPPVGAPGHRNRPLSMAAAGQYAAQLSQPAPFRIGVAEDRNKRWRRTMEDAHTFVYDYGGVHGQGFFGVFDGHAGKASAEWCGKYLYQYLREHLASRTSESVPDVLNATFQSVDVSLADLARDTRTSSGCTAVTCFLRLEDSHGVPLAGPGTGGIMPDDQGLEGQAFIGGASVPSQVEGASTVAVVRTADSHVPGYRIGSVSQVEVIPDPKPKSFLNSLARRAGWSSNRRSRTSSVIAVPQPGSASTSTSASSSPDAHARPELTKDLSDTVLARPLDPASIGLPFRRVLYTANVGDARAVLSRGGRAVRLTYDHKGSDAQETARIKEAGGFVMNNRVNGVLAVTRSLGDTSMKEFVVGKPFTTETTLTDDDAFLIVACDGLWDVTSDQEAVDIVRAIDDAQDAARALLKHALANFSTDNTSVMVIRFNAKPDTGFASHILT